MLTYPEDAQHMDVAEHWGGLTRAALDRIGGDPRTESWLANNQGAIAYFRGDHEYALKLLRRAIFLKESVVGPDHPDLAISLGSMSFVLGKMGKLDEAFSANDRALQILAKSTGNEHVCSAISIAVRADLMLALGRRDEADTLYRRALQLFDLHAPPTALEIAYPLAGLARLTIDGGRPATAIAPLERALLISAGSPDRFFHADVQFQLARALYNSGRDRTRAQNLSAAALDTYAALPNFGVQAGEIRRWRSLHRIRLSK